MRHSLIAFWCALLLSMVGVVTLFSAGGSSWSPWALHHLYRCVLGCVLFFLFSGIPGRFLWHIAYVFYAAMTLLLVGVAWMGTLAMQARRWLSIGIGSLKIQPSEFVKIAVILVLSRYLARNDEPPRGMKFLACLCLIGLPVGLILKQPDLGTAMVVLLLGLTLLWHAGLAFRWFIGGGLFALLGAPLIYRYGLHPYQQARILTFWTGGDPATTGYHVMQSQIALGSGGLYGAGWCQGPQSQFCFLPEKHTDFIVALFGEEWGLFGIVCIWSLYALFLWNLQRATRSMSHPFGYYMGIGVQWLFFYHGMINAGMVMGLLPVVGVPFPFLSYGGSSLLTSFLCLAMLYALEKKKADFS